MTWLKQQNFFLQTSFQTNCLPACTVKGSKREDNELPAPAPDEVSWKHRTCCYPLLYSNMTWIENHSWGAQTTEGFWMQHNLPKVNDSNIATFQLDSCLIKAIFLQFGNCKGKSTVGRAHIFKWCQSGSQTYKRSHYSGTI